MKTHQKMVKKIYEILFASLKSLFVIISFSLFFGKKNLDMVEKTLWRDINEVLLIVFVLLFFTEIVLKFNKKSWILTLICLVTCYLMYQGAFPDGTNLQRILNGHW